MSKRMVIFGLFAAVAALAACHSQSGNQPELVSSVVAAQAEAKHATDGALSCEALEKEFVSVTNDSAIRAYMARGAREVQTSRNAESPFQKAASVLAGQDQSPTEQQRAEAAQQVQKQMEQMSKIMPQLARSQRLMQLSMERNCTSLVMVGTQRGSN